MSASTAPDLVATGIGLKTAAPSSPEAFSWRVLGLLDAFRIAIAIALLITFFSIRDPRILGEVQPGLAMLLLLTMLAFAFVEIGLLRRRWPNLPTQIYAQFAGGVVILLAAHQQHR